MTGKPSRAASERQGKKEKRAVRLGGRQISSRDPLSVASPPCFAFRLSAEKQKNLKNYFCEIFQLKATQGIEEQTFVLSLAEDLHRDLLEKVTLASS
jgi:hypothetical protein